MKTTLPDWLDVHRKKEIGTDLDPIEQFVHDNEPAGDDAKLFRDGLVAALNFALHKAVRE